MLYNLIKTEVILKFLQPLLWLHSYFLMLLPFYPSERQNNFMEQLNEFTPRYLLVYCWTD